MGAAGLAVLLAASSAIVVDGRVEHGESRWEDGIIVTRWTVRVEAGPEGLPGAVVVRQTGGAIGGIGQRSSAEEPLAPGDAGRMTLSPLPDGEYRLDRLVHAQVPRYVRTTTQSTNPPCPQGIAVPLWWGRTVLHYLIDAAGSDDVPFADALAAVQASVSAWEDPSCSWLTFALDGTLADAPIGYSGDGRDVNVVKWLETGWTFGNAYAMTLTTFRCDTGEIVDVDVVLDGEHRVFTTAPVDATAIDVANTLTHEVGHALGFDHSPDPESTMYADSQPGETLKRDLTADDRQGLCDVYALGHEPGDAGPPDAQGPDAQPTTAAGDGCGCTAGGSGRGIGLGALALLLLAAAGAGWSRGRAHRSGRLGARSFPSGRSSEILTPLTLTGTGLPPRSPAHPCPLPASPSGASPRTDRPSCDATWGCWYSRRRARMHIVSLAAPPALSSQR